MSTNVNRTCVLGRDLERNVACLRELRSGGEDVTRPPIEVRRVANVGLECERRYA